MSAGDHNPLVVLHAVRLLGFGTDASVARRFGLDADEVAEVLLDAEAFGRVSRSTFDRVWAEPHEDLIATLGLRRC